MIITKMTLTNFFRFAGCQVINFSTDKRKNVTVIIGENGIGKSTILNAFYWAFYGDVTDPLTEDGILNKNTQANLEPNNNTEASVEIEFKERNKYYILKRKQLFRNNGHGIIKISTPKLSIMERDEESGNINPLTEVNDFFSRIIPKKLRGFFFFDGERIDRLAKIDGKDEIRKAILDILGLSSLEMIQKDLEEVKTDYHKNMKKYMKSKESVLMDEYTAQKSEKDGIEKAIEDLKMERHKALEVIKSINAFLESNNSKVIGDKQKERNEIESELKNITKQLVTKRRDLILHISKNFKNFWICEKHNKVSALLEEKREKGELPSDIKAQFISDLLARGKCICGRDLPPGSDGAKSLEELRKVAGRSELDDAYTRITAYIDFAKSQRSEFFKRYYQIIKEIQDLRNSFDIKKNKMKAISDFLKNVQEDKIAEYEEIREKQQDIVTEKDRKIGQLSGDLDILKRNLDQLNIKIQQANLSEAQAKIFQQRANFVEKLGQLNTEIRTFFIDSTRNNLDEKIKDVFSQLATKSYRQPILTPNFELGIRNTLNGNHNIESLSTGEGQITSLAFIGSLVSYAREKMQTSLLSDFGGGDFPLVMDSPFGNLDDNHTANVARGIGKLASQVIIIVSNKQWIRGVSENIDSRVGKKYELYDGDFIRENAEEYTVITEAQI